jgi:hypothetical protein
MGKESRRPRPNSLGTATQASGSSATEKIAAWRAAKVHEWTENTSPLRRCANPLNGEWDPLVVVSVGNDPEVWPEITGGRRLHACLTWARGDVPAPGNSRREGTSTAGWTSSARRPWRRRRRPPPSPAPSVPPRSAQRRASRRMRSTVRVSPPVPTSPPLPYRLQGPYRWPGPSPGEWRRQLSRVSPECSTRPGHP